MTEIDKTNAKIDDVFTAIGKWILLMQLVMKSTWFKQKVGMQKIIGVFDPILLEYKSGETYVWFVYLIYVFIVEIQRRDV